MDYIWSRMGFKYLIALGLCNGFEEQKRDKKSMGGLSDRKDD